MNGDPFTRTHLRTVDDPVVGGHEAATHRRAFQEAYLCGHRDKIRVSIWNSNVASIAAPVGKARQGGICAYMGLTASAIFADAIALAERHQHTVAFFKVA